MQKELKTTENSNDSLLKFRIWDERFKEFNYFGFDKDGWRFPGSIDLNLIAQKSEQFTGRQTSTMNPGKEQDLYAGDIITYLLNGSNDTGYIYYDKTYAGYMVSSKLNPGECEYLGIILEDSLYVVLDGNIHENPKLWNVGS